MELSMLVFIHSANSPLMLMVVSRHKEDNTYPHGMYNPA